MTPPKALSAVLSLFLLGGSLLAACSTSSSTTPCNQDPLSCPAGQTCWVQTGPDDYGCVPAGPGTNGQPCTPTQSSASCGNGLACVNGTCQSFCNPTDPSHGCPAGQTCASVTLPGGTQSFNACVAGGGNAPDSGSPASSDSGPVQNNDAGPPPGNDSGPPPGNDSGGGDATQGMDSSPCGSTDTVTNCGSCGVTCDMTHSNGATCPSGKCTYTGCAAGYGDCDMSGVDSNGCETSTTTTAACGACGRACSTANATATTCGAGGACAPTCNNGFSSCGAPLPPAADDGCECATPGCCNGGCAVTHQNCVSPPTCGTGATALGQSYFVASNYCLAKGTPGVSSTYTQALAAAAAAAGPQPSGVCSNPPCVGTQVCPLDASLSTPVNAYYVDTTDSGGPCYVWVFRTVTGPTNDTSTAGYLAITPTCDCPIDTTTFPKWN